MMTGSGRTLSPEMERLVTAMQEFDPSDAYHGSDVQEPGYYAAIDRCVALIKGEITDWQSARKP